MSSFDDKRAAMSINQSAMSTMQNLPEYHTFFKLQISDYLLPNAGLALMGI